MWNTTKAAGGDSDALTTAVIERVKTRMEATGFSQVALSAEAGIERSTLIRRLQGRSPFRIDELEAIASALDCTVASLLPEQVA